MKIEIAGKRAIVAGGSRGIGRSIALAFAEAGAGVSICARGAEALATTRDEIAQHGGAAHAAVCDLADAAVIPRYIAEAADALGGIDILVNNASGFGTTDDEAGWAASISVDLLATVRVTRAALPHLEKSEAGVILNISSISGFRASVRTPPYGAVKAAILEYTLTQAAALARKKIRVNCIAPGSIEFPGGTWARAKANNPDLYGRILRSIPFGRLGRPEEVAQVALFLCSPLAGWVTGQNIAVDGGQMLQSDRFVAVDEDLVERMRAVLAGAGAMREVRMFGGLCFMLNGNMLAAASKRGLLVRLGKGQHSQALARPDAKPMEMAGRSIEGYILVDPAPHDDRVLRDWLGLAVVFVKTLPPKLPKPKSARAKSK